MTPTQVWQTHATELPSDPVITFFKVFLDQKKEEFVVILNLLPDLTSDK